MHLQFFTPAANASLIERTERSLEEAIRRPELFPVLIYSLNRANPHPPARCASAAPFPRGGEMPTHSKMLRKHAQGSEGWSLERLG